MMDSQENALNQGTEEVKQSETTVEQIVNNAEIAVEVAEDTVIAATDNQQLREEDTLANTVYDSKKEIVERVKAIADSEETPEKAEVDHLKTSFYRLHLAEREAQQKAFLEAGGDPEKYQVLPDEEEEAFKIAMSVIKEKRQRAFLEQEELKQQNLKKKEAIIEKVKTMATTPEEANNNFQEFKALQQEWKAIKPVPAEKVNELWRSYQLYVEQYYDLLNLNREAREYDFKKNLEKKTQLCEAAEKLADESDVISAFHQLQDLHQEYRETGPVEKELREQVWQRFKAASTIINKRHQQHFEEIRAEEEDNLVKKTALCEKIEGIVKQERKNSGDWDNHSKEIIALQQEWKTIGFTPQKMNTKIFERFRAACDEFFTKKGEYFKELKDKYAENAKRKQELVAKAQGLKDSTDWKKTSDKLIALQKEWKTIGMVPKRLGDQLWEDFLAACNHFFDKLTDEFNKIGHVPFKEKDKMFKEYHDILDKLHKTLNVKASRHRMDNFRNNLKKVAQRGENAIDNERGRLMRRFEQLKQEINTYENNIGFLNISSKKGNSLIDDMNRRVQKLKDELAETKQKIKTIDDEKKA